MVGIQQAALSLLDELARRIGCTYLSDLRFLDAPGRQALARTLADIPAGAAGLREWNDALVYLSGEPPESTAADARARLLERLARSTADLPGQSRHSDRTV